MGCHVGLYADLTEILTKADDKHATTPRTSGRREKGRREDAGGTLSAVRITALSWSDSHVSSTPSGGRLVRPGDGGMGGGEEFD